MSEKQNQVRGRRPGRPKGRKNYSPSKSELYARVAAQEEELVRLRAERNIALLGSGVSWNDIESYDHKNEPPGETE